METKPTTAVSADPNPVAQPQPRPTRSSRAPDTGSAQADHRLIIEEDPDTGSFIYKIIDRRTGEVVSQLPREEVLKLRQEVDYSAGDVIRARA